MATINNIMKAVEALKLFNDANCDVLDGTTRKEKVSHCITIADGICSASVREGTKFPQILGVAIETMLILCDDNDSDVRMIADECLNKIIRATSDGHIVKVQLELYNEIKKNGRARTLRAALWRFALLSPTIRPMKGKAYASNVVPCIVAIVNRSEESVIETLSQSLPLILKSLGVFMTDHDVKTLLNAFFKNISSKEAVLRRASASMIVTTCMNCRKPEISLRYALGEIIDAVVPIGAEENDSISIIGVFGCLRMILQSLHTFSESEIENTQDLNHFLLIYELCLHYVGSQSNHNVVNAALETLTELLKSPNKSLSFTLLSKTGITHHRIFENEDVAEFYSSRRTRISVIQVNHEDANIGDKDSRTLVEEDGKRYLCINGALHSVFKLINSDDSS